MINCAVCKFEVSNKMRHALTKNMCPACGSALLGDFHMQRLNMIKEKISLQDFSRGLELSVIFDMSLFIMSEFFPSSPNRAATGVMQATVHSLTNESEDSDGAKELERIREQVRRDALIAGNRRVFQKTDELLDNDLDEESSNNEEVEYDDGFLFNESDIPAPKSEQDLKVAKLKRLYSESPTLTKSGVSVRRVT